MNDTMIRGRVLTFRKMPFGVHDLGSLSYEEDGAVLIREGRIAAIGDFAQISVLAGQGVEIINHRPHLLLPGFIDPHLHFPQMQVIGSYGGELLDWLNKYTFPEETRFSHLAHATRMAAAFFDEMARNGTTSVSAYCSVHPESAEAFFEEAGKRGMGVIGGKCMMDRNAPDGLRDTPQSGYDESRALIDKWHNRGRLRYAITPRFAITSTPEQLEMCGALAREYPECHIQTHLCENRAEIDLAGKLFPSCQDYTAIYERYGLTGPKSLFGHCIHLSEREADALADSGSVAVFCPTSNLFLGSGLFPYMRMKEREKPLRTAIATDIGGGTSYSLLRTLDEAYKVIALQGKKLDPLRAFWQVTRGNAQALSMEGEIGSLEPGHYADIVVLNSSATPAMALRMETAESLAEELFVLQTLGDDRAVVETYAGGVAQKNGIA